MVAAGDGPGGLAEASAEVVDVTWAHRVPLNPPADPPPPADGG